MSREGAGLPTGRGRGGGIVSEPVHRPQLTTTTDPGPDGPRPVLTLAFLLLVVGASLAGRACSEHPPEPPAAEEVPR